VGLGAGVDLLEARALWPCSVATDKFNELGRSLFKSAEGNSNPIVSMLKFTRLANMPSVCTFSTVSHVDHNSTCSSGARIILASREKQTGCFLAVGLADMEEINP
jgi:hypothetical protein